MGVSSQASSRNHDSSQLIWRETLACMMPHMSVRQECMCVGLRALLLHVIQECQLASCQCCNS